MAEFIVIVVALILALGLMFGVSFLAYWLVALAGAPHWAAVAVGVIVFFIGFKSGSSVSKS